MVYDFTMDPHHRQSTMDLRNNVESNWAHLVGLVEMRTKLLATANTYFKCVHVNVSRICAVCIPTAPKFRHSQFWIQWSASIVPIPGTFARWRNGTARSSAWRRYA